MSVSLILSEKLQEEKGIMRKKKKKNANFWPFWHHYKMVRTWLFVTFLISLCSVCWGQHT